MDNQNFNNSGFGQDNQNFNNSGFNQNADQGSFYGGSAPQGQYSGYTNGQGGQNINMDFNSGYNSNMNQGSNPYVAPPNNGKSPKYTLWLTLAIVQMVLGCCCSGGIFTLVTGILTIVFNNNANDAYKIGDMATYESKNKAAMITNIIGWVLAVLIGIFAISSGAFKGIMEAYSEMM